MRKFLISLLVLIVLVGCGGTFTVNVTVPAGTLIYPMHSFVQYSYSSEEICPDSDKIKITLSSPAPDMTVALIPVNPQDRLKTHETQQYLTPGFPAEFEVIKGAWYKVSLMISNNTNADIVYPLKITGLAEVRIAEAAE